MITHIILALSILNAGAFLVYFYDKAAARRGAWRISESTLLGVAMLGGSLAAIIAMYCFRHKTRKMKFKLGLPLILLSQAGLIVYWRLTGDLPILG